MKDKSRDNSIPFILNGFSGVGKSTYGLILSGQ